jgi:endonuclease YncB( thermonuclease family)
MVDTDKLIFFEDPSPLAIEVPVLKVFDGDGFLTKITVSQLTNNSKDQREIEVAVRFGFIDAPELEQRDGHKAREFLTTLIGGRKVWIDILTKMDTGKSIDAHGRIVAVPYLSDRSPGSMFEDKMNFFNRILVRRRSLYRTRNVEIEMLLNGWAWVLERYGPNDKYFEALADAQKNKRGIWAYEDNVHPWTFKRQKYNGRRRSGKQLETIGECPTAGCDGKLIKRNGKFGQFYGCSNYPNCKYSRSIEK